LPDSETLRQALVQAVNEAKAPGGVAYVGVRDGVSYHGAHGARELVPRRRRAETSTVYDVASLTKVLATTTAVLKLRDAGVLDLDQPVAEIVPIPAFSRFTIRHLLTHTAGLPPGNLYYAQVGSIDELLMRYAGRELEAPPGTRRRYSDVGFMILGKVVELAGRDAFDALCAKRIFRPLGMKHTMFNPPAAIRRQCAATEQCPWRKAVVIGAVHDEHAYAVGGVAGHAGLFSTAGDIARFCRALLEGKVHPEATLREMTRLGQVAAYPWQGLGWLLDPWASAPDGYLPARTAFGHAGWTGTSVWMDYETGLFAILLGNTCHPSRAGRDNDTFRRAFYDGVARVRYPRSFNTHTGLDRLAFEHFRALRGKRVALLTNDAAVDELGRPAAEVLRRSGELDLHILYTPEHGLRRQAEAGEKVASERGPIPVISLFGARRRPSKDELDEVEVFVVDLPDVGSRYYTYIATMKECMAACAERGKTMLILDRPNPLGGVVLEGPVAKRTSAGVCCAPVPVRHGMTLGEMALFFRRRYFGRKRFALLISEVDNWRRDLLFRDCALPWVAPSPNMPWPETALLYAGTCLFEGTNLNEGRGTATPFHVVGAPWLDAEAVVAAVTPEECPGCSLEATRYTPRSIPGKAASPRFRDTECGGVRITVEDPYAVRAFTTAVALLGAIRRIHRARFEWTPSFDVLAGSSDLRERIEAGDGALEIVAGYARALEAFDKTRPKKYS